MWDNRYICLFCFKEVYFVILYGGFWFIFYVLIVGGFLIWEDGLCESAFSDGLWDELLE